MSFKTNLQKLPVQPDIVLIITDQQRATQHFPPGWEQKNMPNLTFLKKNGISFDRAFCNTCMCSPSRATLLTGTYPAHHDVTQTLTVGGKYSPGEVMLDNALPNLMNVLANSGYNVQYRGKWHLSKGTAGDSAYPIGYGALTQADVSLFGGMGWVPPDAGEDVNPHNFGGGYADHDAYYLAQAIQFLQEIKVKRANGINQPYCLVLSLVNPHDVLCYPGKPMANSTYYGYGAADWASREIGLPESVHRTDLYAPEKHRPTAQKQLLPILGQGLGLLPTNDHKLNYINFYGFLLQKADAQISRLINELYKEHNGMKLADSAIVIQTADHGEMGLAHGGLRQKMFVAYEEAIRVPLVFSNPILFQGDTLRNSLSLVTLVDVMPTLMELAKVAVPPTGLGGTSLVPTMEDGRAVQDKILFTFDDTKAGASNIPSMVKAANRIRCIRTEKWKYDVFFDALGAYAPEYELYDLENDPNEMRNLAYDSKWSEVKRELQTELHKLEVSKLQKAPEQAGPDIGPIQD